MFDFRKQHWIFILLLSVSLLANQAFICHAGHTSGISPIPTDLLFQKNRSATSQVLAALLHENRGYYQNAAKIWRSFSTVSVRAKDRLFFNRLATNLEFQAFTTPKTEQSKLTMSRFLSWQKKWSQALLILQHYPNGSRSPEFNLELIRLNLILGQYQTAKTVMLKMDSLNHRDQMQLEIYRIWLHILEGDRKSARISIQKLEENYLYLPMATMVPPAYLGDRNERKTHLITTLKRFPSNGDLFERLLMFLSETEKWEALDEAVVSQRYVSESVVSWQMLAEIYLKTGQYGRLEKLIKSGAWREIGPQYYDVLARLAIAQKNWELLNQVSKAYRSHFPHLMDGNLYQAIYYQETGRAEEARPLIEQAGVGR